MTVQDDSGSILRFARALEAALFDCQREAVHNRACDVYFDADVVIGALFGIGDVVSKYGSGPFAQEFEFWNPQADVPIVVRTLWLTGFACRAKMLWPHEAEFRAKWRNTRSDVTVLLEASRVFAKTFTEARLKEIKEALQSSPQSNEPRGAAETATEPFLRLAKLLPIKDFILAQGAAFPTWAKRVSFVGDRLILRDDLQLLPEAPNGPVIRDLPSVIGMARRLTRMRPSLWQQLAQALRLRVVRTFDQRSFADASALSELQGLVNSDNELVRFYTTTESLIELAGRSMYRGAFTRLSAAPLRDPLDYGVLDDPRGPFRSAQYMFLRCVVPSLAFRDRAETLPEFESAKSFDFERLQRLVDRERDLRSDLSTLGVTLLGETVDRDLPEFKRSFESAAAFSNIWARSDSQALRRLAEQLSRIEAYLKILAKGREAIRTLVDSEILRIDALAARMEQVYLESRILIQDTELADKTIESEVINDSNTLSNTGIGRWLFPSTVNAEVAKLLGDLRAEFQSHEAAKKQRTIWLQMAERSIDVSDAAWLFANAVLFSRGMANYVHGNLSTGLRSSQPLDSLITISARMLRFSAGLSSLPKGAAVPELALPNGESSGIEWTQSMNDAEHLAHMGAWMALYWCHAKLRSLTGSVCPSSDPEHSAVIVAAAHALARLKDAIPSFPALADPASNPVSTPHLMEEVVGTLLALYAQSPDPLLLPTLGKEFSVYVHDAIAWNAMLRRRDDPASKELVHQYVRRRKYVRERYLVEHLLVFETYLRSPPPSALIGATGT